MFNNQPPSIVSPPVVGSPVAYFKWATEATRDSGHPQSTLVPVAGIVVALSRPDIGTPMRATLMLFEEDGSSRVARDVQFTQNPTTGFATRVIPAR